MVVGAEAIYRKDVTQFYRPGHSSDRPNVLQVQMNLSWLSSHVLRDRGLTTMISHA